MCCDLSGQVRCGVVWCGTLHTEVGCLSPLAGDLTVQGFEKKKKKILAPYLTGQAQSSNSFLCTLCSWELTKRADCEGSSLCD